MLARNRKLAIDRIDIGMGTIMAGEASCTCHCWIIVIHGRWCPAVGVVVAGDAIRASVDGQMGRRLAQDRVIVMTTIAPCAADA